MATWYSRDPADGAATWRAHDPTTGASGGVSGTGSGAFSLGGVASAAVAIAAVGAASLGLVGTASAHPTPAFSLSPSSYIADSAATATTPRLTPPAGKSTGDHFAGRVSDDTNPLPSLNPTADSYVEVEFCLQAAAWVPTSDVYEFRFTIDGAPLDTETVTPTWEIGAASEVSGVGDGSLALAGAGAAQVAVQGAGAGALALDGAGAAQIPVQGSGAGSLGLAGTGAGTLPVDGQGRAPWPSWEVARGRLRPAR